MKKIDQAMSTAPRRGRIWAIVFTVPALVVLLALGFWQLHRLSWKETLMTEQQSALAQTPVNHTTLTDNLSALAYRRAELQGNFLSTQKFYIGPRSHQGQAGFHVLSPFRLTDGRILLVNRGFVPGHGAVPLPWEDKMSTARHNITGILRHPADQSWMMPDNLPSKGNWFWYDLDALSGILSLDLLPLVLDLAASDGTDEVPIAGQTQVTLVNNHLQYAVTWFLFALVLTVIFIIFMARTDKVKGPE